MEQKDGKWKACLSFLQNIKNLQKIYSQVQILLASSKFLEKNNVLSVVNQDIEDTKKTPFSAEKINALSKKFEQLSVDNPKAFPDENEVKESTTCCCCNGEIR